MILHLDKRRNRVPRRSPASNTDLFAHPVATYVQLTADSFKLSLLNEEKTRKQRTVRNLQTDLVLIRLTLRS